MRGQPQAAQPEAREVIRDFTRHYRQHMRSEEEQFVRLAERHLSRNDWASLDFALFDRDDPLFDHAEEERFSALRQRIEETAEQRKARRWMLEAANELRGLSGIESFNQSMKSAAQWCAYCYLRGLGWPARKAGARAVSSGNG
jgi:hypothetical protein